MTISTNFGVKKLLFTLSTVLLALCLGCPDPSNGSFCERMEAGTNHLRAVLQNCPGSGDASIYVFDRDTCDAQAASKCTASELASLESVAACSLNIKVCANPADRSRATADVSACSDGSTISAACVAALGNH